MMEEDKGQSSLRSDAPAARAVKPRVSDIEVGAILLSPSGRRHIVVGYRFDCGGNAMLVRLVRASSIGCIARVSEWEFAGQLVPAGWKVIRPPRLQLADMLRAHWLTGIHCDHEAKTDVATCYCAAWRSEPQPSVGAAVERWIEHVLASEASARSATPPSPSPSNKDTL